MNAKKVKVTVAPATKQNKNTNNKPPKDLSRFVDIKLAAKLLKEAAQ